MTTLLFNFQDLKLSTRDIIIVLKDTLNITSGSLPISDPHAIRVPSNTLERHSINSRVIDGIRNLVTNSSMGKLAFLRLILHSHIKKELRITSLVDLILNKGIVDSHSLHKVS